MKRSLYVTTAALAALSACNQGATVANNMAATDLSANVDATAANTPAAAEIDSTFVTDSIKGDTAEVAIGQLAASKGTSDAVKDFGNMLATDHGAHKQKLIELATSAGIPVPEEPAAEGHANLAKLQGLGGTAFDEEFARMMVESHNKGIAKNEAQAQSGDAQTSELARQTLPTLRKHLQIPESLAK